MKQIRLIHLTFILLLIGASILCPLEAFATESTPPTLSVRPSSGNINPRAIITVTAYDSSGINHIGYVWDDGSTTTPVYASTANITAPSSVGSHTLYVYAKDDSSNYNFTGWKSYNYTIITSTSDTIAPTLDVNPTSGNIQPGSTINVTASDPSGINHIGYVWDNGSSTTPVYSDIANIIAPSTTGLHTLYVYAKDNSSTCNSTGWKNYNYTIISSSYNDTIPPTLSASPSSGDITAGSVITVTASDFSGISKIIYNWDNSTSLKTSTSSITSIKAPTTIGTHTLYVYAKDNSVNYNSSTWISYIYNITATTTPDSTSPTITINPDSGNIETNASILITATDSSGISEIGYNWDNSTSAQTSTSNPVSINAPTTTGAHILYVYAKDNSTNHNSTDWKTYNYNVTSSSTSNDTTPPTLSANPGSGNIQAGSTITISAIDTNGIYQIGYLWDNGSNITTVDSSSASVIAPITEGTHTLYVYAKDNSTTHNNSGWISYTYTITNLDSTPPTITIDPDSGNIISNDSLLITAADSNGIFEIGYNWDSSTSAQISTSSSVYVNAPTTFGSHILYVYAKDNSTNRNSTGWKTYNYNVTSSSTSDTSPPTLSANPSSGNIQAGSTITITATDTNGIYQIGYLWDNGSTVTTVDSSSASVIAPDTVGAHILYIYVKDNSANHNNSGWTSYTYNITAIVNPDSTPPTITVNPDSDRIVPNASILITAADLNGISELGYNWDNSTITVISNISSIIIHAPNSTGAHTLNIYAKDNSISQNNSGWKVYTYSVN